jgi:hypothetical protein
MLVQNIAYYTDVLPEGFPINSGTNSELSLISTIGMLTVKEGERITDEYKLKETLIAIVKLEDENYVVVENRTDEYGIGESLEEAQQDLFNSLVDYFSSIEKRERKLGDRERHNLQILREILVK